MAGIFERLFGGDRAPRGGFDPRQLAHLEDPASTYRTLRQTEPVCRTDLGWFVSRYDDALSLLNDRRFGHPCPAHSGLLHRLTGPVGRMRRVSLVSMNPPEHTRLKRVVSQLLSAAAVEKLRPTIAETAARLFDRVRDSGRMDLVRDFAAPLPFGVACELLGIPEADHERVWGMMQPLPGVFDVLPHGSLLHRWRSVAAIRTYFFDLVAEHRRHPVAGIGALIEAQRSGAVQGDDELLATCILLLEAGHLTTVHLLSNGVLALLRAPEELERLRREPTLLPQAVEELLRYGTPARLVGRMAFEDVVLRDHELPRGGTVYALLSAANRDEARFADPDRLDIGSRATGHLAFGAGPHFCPGATLARATAQTALELLLRRTKSLELDSDHLEPIDLIFLQGWKSVPVRFVAS